MASSHSSLNKLRSHLHLSHFYLSLIILILTCALFGTCFFYNNIANETARTTILTSYEYTDVNTAFEEYTSTLFINEISYNTLNLYYTLDDYDSYGITHTDVSFGSFSTDSAASLIAVENQLRLLATFNYESLTTENQITYDVLQDSFTNGLESGLYSLYYEPLSPYTGLHTQLPILLAEFPLDSEEDVEVYLSLLNTLPEYFQSLLAYEEAKSEAGLFMSNSQLDTVLAECAGFMEMNDNYLLSTFDTRIQEIQSLDSEMIDGYNTQNSEVFYNAILPAYEALVNVLESLRDTGTNDQGLCYYENGMNYYAYLAKINTGSGKTLPELQVFIENQILEDLLDLQEAMLELDGGELEDVVIEGDFEEILCDLQDSMGNFYPEAPEVSITIQEIPEELEDYLSPAFYLIPTIDNTYKNTIYMNNARMTDDLTIYTTLAHEGYPGHLYQTTYFASTDPNPVRYLFQYGGYTEGWATYVEMCSYYLGAISSPEETILQKSASLHLGIYAYTDIGIHYEGWSLADTIDYYGTFGITDVAIIEQIYNLIVATPSNYLKYYVGYLEFLELKQECIQEWGESFSQLRFHEAVLDIGPVSFDILSKYVLGS